MIDLRNLCFSVLSHIKAVSDVISYQSSDEGVVGPQDGSNKPEKWPNDRHLQNEYVDNEISYTTQTHRQQLE